MSRESPLWYRLPLILTSPRPSLGVGSFMAALAATPMLLWLLIPHAYIVDGLTEQAWTALSRDPYVQSLEPERQAAIPKRISDALWSTYPKFALLGLAAGVVAAAAYVIVARLLRPVFTEKAEPTLFSPIPTRSSYRQWIAPLLVALMGFAAHVPYIEKSLNIDEAYFLQRMRANGWYCIDTRWGWWVHVGGLAPAQLSALLFGYGEWAVRLPAAILSSVGLGVFYAWVRSLHGSRVALLSAGFLAIWPVWAEQCATARGYGLSFLCCVVAAVCLWRLLDEDRPHLLSAGSAVWLLFFAALFGCLAHFLWMFLGLSCLLLLFWQAYFRRRMAAAAAAFFTGTAMTLAGLVYAPGLPNMLFRTSQVGSLNLWETALQMIQGFGFHAEWPANAAITCVVAGLGARGLVLLPSIERRRVLLILLVGIGILACLQPVYLVPRFFMHLFFLWYVPMVPLGLLLDQLFQPRLALAAATVLLFAAVLWVQPWAQLPMADLRGLAFYCQSAEESGEPCVLSASLHSAAIYPLGSQTQFANFTRGEPPTARRIARSFPTILAPPSPPEGFQRVKFFPGWNESIEVLER